MEPIKSQDRNQQLVAVVAHSTTEIEKDALATWARQLLALRISANSPVQKARQALALTARGPILGSAVKIISRELKRLGWDDRSWAARFGLGGAALGLAIFGGQGAGIAALGSAVGVPLWVVFGSGAAFAGVVVEEFSRKK